MPRAKQVKVAESKKRTASTKSVSDEELSPKRAKEVLLDVLNLRFQNYCPIQKVSPGG